MCGGKELGGHLFADLECIHLSVFLILVDDFVAVAICLLRQQSKDGLPAVRIEQSSRF